MKEVVFYGQDYSPIDKSYYLDGTKLKKIDSDDNKKELLSRALDEINRKLDSSDESSRIVVGQTVLDDNNDVDNRKKRKFEISNMVFENGKNIIKFGPLVGTVTVPIDKRLVKIIIFSRFDKINEDEPEKTSPYFLASMLLKGKLKFHDRQVNFSYDNLFDFYMLWLLKKHFMEAMQKGFFKKYQRFERNDDRVRGAIDISRHIRLNMGLNNGRIAYSYRENSVDNPINHLILTSYDYLKEKYPDMVENNTDYELEQMLKELKYAISYPKYSRRSIISLNQMPIAHPFFTEYEELRKVCLKIMRDEGVSPFQSESESLDGLLYYVPDLWEEYLQDVFERKCREFNRNLDYYEYDDNNDNESSLRLSVKAQEKIYIMTDMDNDKNEQNTSYPDFVFSYEEQGNSFYESEQEKVRFCILDAKYKPDWKYALKGKLLPKLREDYDKCIRDMESVNGTATGVVFPMKSEDLKDSPVYMHQFSKFNKIRRFYTIPIEIPKIEEDLYYKWDKKMCDSIDKTMSNIINSLKYEACLHQKMKKATEDIMKDYYKVFISCEDMWVNSTEAQ
ncbi:MAG: hypothetical protein IJ661_03340 [Lachnospiraceae bacterium]|nr:hypothetical protein [Lachnospiraceae bacterium]